MAIPDALLGMWNCWEIRDDGVVEPRGLWLVALDRIETSQGTFTLASIAPMPNEGRDAYELRFSETDAVCLLGQGGATSNELFVRWRRGDSPEREYVLLRPRAATVDGKPFSLALLSPFAHRFAQRLLQDFPEWRDHANLFNPSPFPESEPSGGFELRWEVPLPNRSGSARLFALTDSDLEYVIVGIGPGSAELADWHCDRGEEAIFSEAMTLLHDIIEGRYVGIRLRNGSSVLESMPGLAARDDVEEVVSWSGTVDGRSTQDRG